MSDSENANVIKVTTDTFRADVMEKSMEVPVVVDFWAEWCEPCRQLMPLMEKLADEFSGRFLLAKVNVDECPEIAHAFGVQSIPVVVALHNGQPVNQFQGVLPEPQLREWLGTFVNSPDAEAFSAGEQLEAEGKTEEAEQQFRKAVELNDKQASFKIAHARTLLALDRTVECQEVLDLLEARGFLEPEAERLKEQLHVMSQVEESGGVTAARSALAADPENPERQLDLADALGSDKRFEECCELCLTIVRSYRDQHGDRAREIMVRTLELMGKSKTASDYRRQLATALY